MKRNESPAPRANAESRAAFNEERRQNKASSGDWEAEAAAAWFAVRLSIPSALARVLGALACLARAFG